MYDMTAARRAPVTLIQVLRVRTVTEEEGGMGGEEGVRADIHDTTHFHGGNK